MTARLMSLLIWAAVLAGAVYWGLRLFTRATPVPAGAVVATATVPTGASLARLLGTPPVQAVSEAAPVAADSRFRLLGVVAPRRGQDRGLALISVDGKPARAIGVGRELEPGLRLLTVGHRQAELGPARGSPAVTLALPPVAEANRGRPGDPSAMLPPPVLPMAGRPALVPRMPQVMPQGLPGMAAMPPSTDTNPTDDAPASGGNSPMR